jgi:hypothetical protein
MKQGFLQGVFWMGVLGLFMTRVALAWSPADQHDISLMENRLFSQVYEREAPDVRLNRIEQAVYGVKKTGQVEARLSALRKTLPVLAQQPGPAMPAAQARPLKPAGKSPGQAPAGQTATAPAAVTPQKQSGESDYPLVDELERRVLTQTFPQDDLTVRVPRLEAQVFGQPQQGDWSNRVDALHDKVIGRGKATPNPNDDPDVMASDPGEFNVSPEQVQPAVARMEQQLFKQTYAHEPMETRLARIETKLFNKPAPPELTAEERVERIIAVAGGGGERPAQTRSTAANIAIQLAPILIMMLPLVI